MSLFKCVFQVLEGMPGRAAGWEGAGEQSNLGSAKGHPMSPLTLILSWVGPEDTTLTVGLNLLLRKQLFVNE